MAELHGDGGAGRPDGMLSPDLLVSIVSYAPDVEVLALCLRSLGEGIAGAFALGKIARAEVVIVDNGPGVKWADRLRGVMLDALSGQEHVTARVITGHGNVGFGAGHNMAAESCASRYYLVLNPDVILDQDAVANAVDFMERNPGIGLLTPFACDGNGNKQFLCKRYPAVFDLFLRGFAPSWLKGIFSNRLQRYEMRDMPEQVTSSDLPIVSGCFMFMRREVWDALNGFDPRYFLYFEDFDFSLRAGKITRLAYVPSVRIKHFGGDAARKGIAHIRMFVASAKKFYATWGLRLW